MEYKTTQADAATLKRDGCIMGVTQQEWPFIAWRCDTCTTEFYMRGAPGRCPQCGCHFNTFRTFEHTFAAKQVGIPSAKPSATPRV